MIAVHEFQYFEPRCAGQGVAAESATNGARRDAVKDVFPRRHHPQRNTAGNGLCRRDDVGHDAGFFPVFRGKEAACPAKTGLDFVSDEEDAIGIADFTKSLHKGNRCRNEAAFTLERFQDDSRYIGGWRCFFKYVVYTLDTKVYFFVFADAFRPTIKIGVFCPIHAIGKGPHTDGIGFFEVMAMVMTVRP